MNTVKRFIFTLVVALLLPVSAVYAQDDCSKVGSSLEMVPCSEAAKKAADAQLNVSYKRLMSRLESDYRADPALGKEYAAKVKESQRAWLKLRDANCPLEAFEIESGMPAHVFAVNSCIARMSRKRSTYLDKISPEQLQQSSDKSAACPSEDFMTFLEAFSADSQSQRRLTAMTVKSLVLKPAAEAGRFEPIVTGVKGAELSYPLMAPIPSRKIVGVKIQEVDDSHSIVVDKRAGWSNMKVFNFSRQACWVLEGVEDWSISAKELVVASKPKMSKEENFCYQRAEAFEALGAPEDQPLTVELYEATLENLLCAARSGDPLASYKAAILSLSGMAPQVPTDTLESLFKAAATTLPLGAMGLSQFYCDGNELTSTGPCKHPALAEETLIHAAKTGSPVALSFLGSAFERGEMKTKDMARALACYQMAVAQGDEGAIRMLEHLKQDSANELKASYCF
ncbi:lysozyme inhibitor LprI family protein [Pseudomonas sp. TWP3-2]|uniref:lysozyme inhibitor LprI family protein n=1 Tax=Pseudomonas sp. TWP3-2 TaxID=2804574 RepID=UPI003CEC4F46